MTVRELNLPRILDENSQVIGYGGNQEWYADKWARQAGCASVTAANIAACYALNDLRMAALAPDSQARMKREEYLALMGEMYSRMKPGLMGYPYPDRLGREFSIYAKEKGINLIPTVMTVWKDWREGYQEVKESIDAGGAVGFLILKHRAPELQEDLWHWITICGYEEEDQPDALENKAEAGNAAQEDKGAEPGRAEVPPVLIVSDCGERDRYPAPLLLEIHRNNMTRMVFFRRLPDTVM